MPLTLHWTRSTAQFRRERRPIKLAAAAYSRRRWLLVEAIVWEAQIRGMPPRWYVLERRQRLRELSVERREQLRDLDAPVVAVEEDNPWTDMDEEVTPLNDMDEEVGEMGYSPGSEATTGSPPGISLSWLTPAEFDAMDGLEAAARGQQFEALFTVAEAAGGEKCPLCGSVQFETAGSVQFETAGSDGHSHRVLYYSECLLDVEKLDSDAEDHGLEREQPETTAILANLQPGCDRYFFSGCHDVLQWWCRNFGLRFLFCSWADWVGEEYGRKCGGIASPIMDATPYLLQ